MDTDVPDTSTDTNAPAEDKVLLFNHTEVYPKTATFLNLVC